MSHVLGLVWFGGTIYVLPVPLLVVWYRKGGRRLILELHANTVLLIYLTI